METFCLNADVVKAPVAAFTTPNIVKKRNFVDSLILPIVVSDHCPLVCCQLGSSFGPVNNQSSFLPTTATTTSPSLSGENSATLNCV